VKKLLIILSVLSLTGCGLLGGLFHKPPDSAPPAAKETKVVVDPKLLQACERLPNLAANTYEQVAEHYLTVISLYGQCALKQLESIEAIRKLSNLDK
jgi:predicted small lipoprotein YifL